MFDGIIVAESLRDPAILKEVRVRGIREEGDWHIYQVRVTPEQFADLTMLIQPGWYMHFWNQGMIIVVFTGRMFKFPIDDRNSWEPAIRYGVAQGIPQEQLTFAIE